MANSYDLYLGGRRTNNPDTSFFPSAPYDPTLLVKAAAHKSQIEYALTRVIDPSATSPITNDGTIGDPALRNFIDFQALTAGIPIAQGDILRCVILPNGCLFQGFFWEVQTPLPGFSFSVGFSRIGNGAYVVGSKVIPNGTIGTILLNAQNGAVASRGFVGCDGVAYPVDTATTQKVMQIGSGTIDMPLSDCLAIRLDTLANTGVGAVTFGNLRLKISPVVKELVRGQW